MRTRIIYGIQSRRDRARASPILDRGANSRNWPDRRFYRQFVRNNRVGWQRLLPGIRLFVRRLWHGFRADTDRQRWLETLCALQLPGRKGRTNALGGFGFGFCRKSLWNHVEWRGPELSVRRLLPDRLRHSF